MLYHPQESKSSIINPQIGLPELVNKSETITIPTVLPRDYEVAVTAVLKLQSRKYYSAYLDRRTNNVYIGPKISEEMAKAIVIANNPYFGVFTLNSREAKTLAQKLGTPLSDNVHGQSGYYKHYHVIFPNNIRGLTHIWYYA